MGRSYSYQFKQKDAGGVINFRTDDDDIYQHVTHYIETLIDAENYRRTLHPTLWAEGTEDGVY